MGLTPSPIFCFSSILHSILHSASLLKEWYPGLESVVECDAPTVCDGVEMKEWSEDLSSDADSVELYQHMHGMGYN